MLPPHPQISSCHWLFRFFFLTFVSQITILVQVSLPGSARRRHSLTCHFQSLRDQRLGESPSPTFLQPWEGGGPRKTTSLLSPLPEHGTSLTPYFISEIPASETDPGKNFLKVMEIAPSSSSKPPHLDLFLPPHTQPRRKQPKKGLANGANRVGTRNAADSCVQIGTAWKRVVCSVVMGHQQCPKLTVAGRDTAAAMAFPQTRGAKSPL